MPEEYLTADPFAAMLTEAEKYLGYPMLGRGQPVHVLDCSGFVSWVLNHSGWDMGRLGFRAL